MKKFLSVTLSLLLAASMPLSALAETYEGSYALTPSGGECTASLLLKGAAA